MLAKQRKHGPPCCGVLRRVRHSVAGERVRGIRPRQTAARQNGVTAVNPMELASGAPKTASDIYFVAIEPADLSHLSAEDLRWLNYH